MINTPSALLFLLLLPTTLWAQQPRLKELRDDLDAMIGAPEWTGANVGVAVTSLESGEPLYQRRDNAYFVPASMQKLYTTSAALALLGPDYRFTSTLHLDGSIGPNGEFTGNIIIRGGADPSWSRAFGRDPLLLLEQWADALDSLGIRAIKGNIIGDDDVVDDVDYAPGWAWDDFAYAYAPQVGGLNIGDNAVDVVVTAPSRLDDIPTVRVLPETDYVRVVNAIRVVDSTGVTDITPLRDFRSNVVDLVGSIAVLSRSDTVRLRVSVDNPTLHFLHLFRGAVQRKGIRVRGALIDVDDWIDPIPYERLPAIASISSPPLSEIVSVINHTSHNLGAEVVLKMLGKERGQEGSFTKGVDVVRMWLQQEGITGSDITFVDGSGLSRLNLSTPHQVVALLGRMHRSSLAATFRASLGAPGEPGTLRRRMVGTRAETSVRAKTGGMNNISTLAGYATTRDGEPLAFAIMIGNSVVPPAMAQNLQDLICMRLASFSRR